MGRARVHRDQVPARLLEVTEQALKAAGKLGVPFAPVVPAGLGVELVIEMPFVEAGCEAAIRFEQRLLVSGGEIEKWRRGGIG